MGGTQRLGMAAGSDCASYIYEPGLDSTSFRQILFAFFEAVDALSCFSRLWTALFVTGYTYMCGWDRGAYWASGGSRGGILLLDTWWKGAMCAKRDGLTAESWQQA